ncbi:hypothetical protein Tco_0074576 [Tanacetum coccineum]
MFCVNLQSEEAVVVGKKQKVQRRRRREVEDEEEPPSSPPNLYWEVANLLVGEAICSSCAHLTSQQISAFEHCSKTMFAVMNRLAPHAH